MLCCLCSVRRRRRGQGVLPGPNGGYGKFNVPFAGANGRSAGPGYNPGAQPQEGYPQSQGVVPPPYPGSKEQYGAQPTAGAQPGGFAPPPGPPPAAHVNDNVSIHWHFLLKNALTDCSNVVTVWLV